MSAQDAVRFLVRAGENAELNAQLRATPPADIPALARAHGFSFTAAELAFVARAELEEGELTEAQLERASGGALDNQPSGDGAIDPNALVQWVLRESYMESTEDLASYAEKVKYFNQVKKTLREWPPP
jgi:predicted ribosomally synthesized peptide with nif11-like leader